MVTKKYEILGIISSKLPDKDKPILVGGSAIEFYTRGVFRSLDLDLIGKRSIIGPLLIEMGFKVDGRYYYIIDVTIEIVSSSTNERVNILTINGFDIKIISIEDLIIDRLNACQHWDSVDDCDQAKMLLVIYKYSLDKEYLDKRARKEGIYRLLQRYWNEELK